MEKPSGSTVTLTLALGGAKIPNEKQSYAKCHALLMEMQRYFNTCKSDLKQGSSQVFHGLWLNADFLSSFLNPNRFDAHFIMISIFSTT